MEEKIVDRVSILNRYSAGEVITEEEQEVVHSYLAELMEKTGVDYKDIEKMMYRGVPRADRRPTEPVRTTPKIGRNEPCPCGSGVKFKKCCGK